MKIGNKPTRIIEVLDVLKVLPLSSSESKTVKPASESKAEIDQLYQVSIERVIKDLSTSESGLTEDEIAGRISRFGSNRVERLGKTPIVLTFFSNFTHMMALLLWAGGAIAFGAGLPQLGVAIWLVNIINGVFSFFQEFKAEKATEALLKLVPKQARVLRDGLEKQISAEHLVPGDILILDEGDDIAADARLIEDEGLFVDQSLLTGESAPVRKTTCEGNSYYHPNRGHSDVLYAGTSVTAGAARAVVIATGMKSRFGNIAHLTQSIKDDDSPLQKEMSRVTTTVTFLAVGIGAVFFSVAVLFLGVSLTDSFIFALGMIVAFVPEGMLPTVSLSLAIAVQQMAARNAIVKKLSSVETLGCTTVICSDKTGTLTRNEMTVTNVWCPEHEIVLRGNGYDPAGNICTADGTTNLSIVPEPVLNALIAAARCSNARLISPSPDNSQWSIIGDPTEGAIICALQKAESVSNLSLNNLDKRLDGIAFDPHRKRMSTLWRTNAGYTAYVKGSPRELLELCTNFEEAGQKTRLDDNERAIVCQAVDKYARRGLRVLAIAKKDFSEEPQAVEELIERDLTFLGLVAMVDPLHEEVPEALRKCKSAGIRVIMITGDYELTALSIARQAGIVSEQEPRVITGRQLRSMSDAQLNDALKGELIFARTSPEDKLRIVRAFQSLGDIVAVTGDGVNDAPALKQADIGIAMGKSGTDVARESADIVLSDDNFTSIVSAVELGRSVYNNIRKFAVYVFTSNVAEAVPFAVLLFSRGLIPLPMTLMQVLLIDLGTDMVPAIGLGADPPHSQVMSVAPRNPNERLLNKTLLTKVFFWYGAITSVAAISGYLYVNWLFGWPAGGFAPAGSDVYHMATTAAVAAVVACQIGTALCCRTDSESILNRSLFQNKILLSGIAVEILLMISVMLVPSLKSIFGTDLVPLQAIPFILLWVPIMIVLDETRKLIARTRKF